MGAGVEKEGVARNEESSRNSELTSIIVVFSCETQIYLTMRAHSKWRIKQGK